MKKLFFFFISFLSCYVYSQDTLVIDNSYWVGELQNGLQNGFWREYSFIDCLNDNQLISEGYFEGGEKHGAWKFYGVSHQCDMELQSHGNFVNGKKEGEWIYEGGYAYYTGVYNHDLKQGEWLFYDREVSDSNVTIEENYLNGVPDGFWKWYDPDNGKILASGQMSKGQMIGVWKTPGSIGELMINPDTIIYKPHLQDLVYRVMQDCEDLYETDNKIGDWKYFYEGTNSLSSTGTYLDGKIEGVWKKFHFNGAVKFLGEYQNGKKEGIWREYYENGNLKALVTYIDGKLNGDCEFYSNDGFLIITGSFTDSNRSGEWKSYSKDSLVINVGNYNGLPDEYKLSREQNCCELEVEICENIFKLSSDGYYLPECNKQGFWTEFNSNGGFIEKGRYDTGKRIGKWEVFSNNDLKSIYTYNDGVLDGDFVEFNLYYKYVWRCGKYENGEINVMQEYEKGEGQSKEEYLKN